MFESLLFFLRQYFLVDLSQSFVGIREQCGIFLSELAEYLVYERDLREFHGSIRMVLFYCYADDKAWCTQVGDGPDLVHLVLEPFIFFSATSN